MVEAIHASPGSEFTVTKYSTLGMINQLQNSLTVTENGKDAGVLSLTYTGEDREQIRDILNSIARNYQEQNIERKSAEASKTSLSSRNSYRKYVAASMLPKTN